jgi:hypothetical protein
MSLKQRVVALLVLLYPRRWRREYGEELAATLLARPLTPGGISDVAWSAANERLRASGVATRLGAGGMLITSAWLAADLAAPPSRADSWAWLLRDSGITLPTLIVVPLQSGFAIVAAAAYGFWRREHDTRKQVARDAAWICLLAGLPVMGVAALMALGVLSNPDPQRYRTLAMFAAPLLAVPGAALYACLGMGRPNPRGPITQLHLSGDDRP